MNGILKILHKNKLIYVCALLGALSLTGCKQIKSNLIPVTSEVTTEGETSTDATEILGT